MEITKTVPVTIGVASDPLKCGDCVFYGCHLGNGWCNRYGDLPSVMGRHPACLAEFRTDPNPMREYVLNDDQLWAAILGMQAAIRECNDEWQGMEDPESSQADENWFAASLRELIELREKKQ